MASENCANTENPDENGDSVGISDENTDSEEQLKRQKVRTKSYFTRSKNKLLFLVDNRKHLATRMSKMHAIDWTGQ